MTAIALTIAGSDSGGGAGIQADLKTFSALGVYGASVLTAITAQNTRGVTGVEDVSASMIGLQMRAVFDDLSVNAVKIGMVSRSQTIGVIADGLSAFRGPVVVDPVMVATSGDRLLQEEAIETLIARLLPRAAVVTPNLPEAALLTGQPVATEPEAMVAQARRILDFGAGAVLIKGGHGADPESIDYLVTADAVTPFAAPRIETSHDHGTGCTLAAALTAQLAQGLPLVEACQTAKTYLHAALSAGRGLTVGKGRGPVHHFHQWWTA
ncbi:bifunctional hydroxymethylpyrimidine kinase/phosphomethylpyrimidine kinase [Rhizobium sp. SSA_523]|uniref:bifunctional hydroxymethylpyrimidine kinase/phosphomethylpyrimidine kinase n=1 Tax=Rhizobium sp. SSA_523 TaxID=2952477 RepID=UPI0020907004|nr:bifunctional hydroxymethylpyrimidine kinase/phosphomethylpyrimidine kinase [Rhizobium sp. SSA_523]MCO5731426.1 bifunctional hydroxymethylpyrimidine kinase/phosphomethylpyrimidine kinase [Rhizobium sp. SSA_523]WKC22051.1 bifunctional hydroxymethylpyrimidine kinase/phosphomethylpyrimidine kinase [Rhizobium sp. SSA_523]